VDFPKCKKIVECELRDKAFKAIKEAERAVHAYACALDIGEERTKAFEIFENIRTAARVGS